MQLVGTLAAGVVGAEGGYARIFVRGSTKRARYYADFEGSDAVDGDVQLDANGGAVIYTNITVEVLVYGENDLLIRRWVESSTAACVEVISPSFTGADYETGVGGPRLPTTAAAVFDRLVESFGAEDFLVRMPDGSKVTLQEAFASLQIIFFNVKDPIYGAKGDGIADDSVAIQKAITASLPAGGTIFFPPGTYYVGTAQFVVPSNVNLLGSGATNTSLVSERVTVNSAVLQLGNAGLGVQTVQGFAFRFKAAGVGEDLLNIVAGSKVSVSRCSLEAQVGDAITVEAGKTYLTVEDTDLGANVAGSVVFSYLLPRVGRIDVRRSRIFARASYAAGLYPLMYGAGIHLLSCVYDGLQATTSVSVFGPTGVGSAVPYGSVRCCEFYDAAGFITTCMTLGNSWPANGWFAEDGNFLAGNNTLSVLVQGAFSDTPGYYCKLGSRESRMKSVTNTFGTYTISQAVEYGCVSIRSTFAGNFAVNVSADSPFGARLRVVVVNGSLANRTLTFGANCRGGSFVLAPGGAVGFELVRAVANNGAANVAAWYVIGTSGALVTGPTVSYPV
jgi:hypothetical protein